MTTSNFQRVKASVKATLAALEPFQQQALINQLFQEVVNGQPTQFTPPVIKRGS